MTKVDCSRPPDTAALSAWLGMAVIAAAGSTGATRDVPWRSSFQRTNPPDIPGRSSAGLVKTGPLRLPILAAVPSQPLEECRWR